MASFLHFLWVLAVPAQAVVGTFGTIKELVPPVIPRTGVERMPDLEDDALRRPSDPIHEPNYNSGVERVGLFEYLGRRVPDWSEGETTRISVVDETYDDDPAVGRMGVPFSESTRVTEFTGETHDDDPGVQTAAYPRAASTVITRTDGETYDDDPGLGSIAIPRFGTRITLVEAETHDDDPGLGPLSHLG